MTAAGLWLVAPERVELRHARVPEPAAGEALVRTTRTLISTGTELTMFSARAPAHSVWGDVGRMPRPMGYSHVGEVAAVGAGVDAAWVGRRVATRGPHAAWVCRQAADLRPLPDGVSDEEATCATLAGVVMNGLRRVGLGWGESVCVCGLGLVGNLAAQAAGALGAGPVAVVERAPRRRALLPRRPWVVALEGADLELSAQLPALRGATGGRGFDVVIEATGDPRLIPAEAQLLAEGGRLLLLSSPAGETAFDFHDLCNRRSLSIVGAHGSSQPPPGSEGWSSRRHALLFFDWLRQGRLEVRQLLTHRFLYERAAEAYELLASRREEALGVLLDWA